MQHLAAVNRLLVKLGSCPYLDRQDFPYEPDIYPFAFNLEPMSRTCLAKFVYCKAPSDVFDVNVAKGPADKAFCQRVIAEFGGERRLNHVGSLYRCVLGMLEEVSKAKDSPLTLDEAAEWRVKFLTSWRKASMTTTCPSARSLRQSIEPSPPRASTMHGA